MRAASLIVAWSATALIAGCAFDVEPCTSDDDCPADSFCSRPPGTPSAACVWRAPADAGTPHRDIHDAAHAPEDSGDVPDAQSDEHDTTIETPVREGVCHRDLDCDPFHSDDDPITPRPVGCPTRAFEPWRTSFESTICPQAAHRHEIEYVRCADRAFEIEIEMDVGWRCAGEATFFFADLGCDDPGVECEVAGNGKTRVSVLIHPSPYAVPVETLEFGIDRPNFHDPDAVEYVLTVNVVEDRQ